MLGNFLLALHLLAAVIWVGGMAFALLVLRPSMGILARADRLPLHREVLRRFFLLVWHAMAVVLATGFAMVAVVYGGFPSVHWNVHAMLGLGLLMSALFLLIVFGPWRRLKRTDDLAALDRIRHLVQVNLVLGLITVFIAAFN